MNVTKLKKLLIPILLISMLSACAGKPQKAQTSEFPTFKYTHFASGGTQEEYTAVILFEQANSTFTEYQVAFSSCTCRDPSANYYSVCYVELLNNKPTAEESAIRAIAFGQNRGLYGDSNPNHYISEYTEEYMDANFVQSLVYDTKADIDAWGGYGTQVAGVNADAVTGATVSTSNITSMLQGLFKYHAEHYYK